MKLRTQLLIGFTVLFGLMFLMIELGIQLDHWGNPTLIGIVALLLVLALAVMLYLWQQVFGQIGGEPSEIAVAAQQIAKGNLEVELPGESGIAGAIGVITATLKDVAKQVNTIAAGNYSADIAARSDKDELGIALQVMTAALRSAHQTSTALDWLKSSLARLGEAISGDPALETLAAKAITQIKRVWQALDADGWAYDALQALEQLES